MEVLYMKALVYHEPGKKALEEKPMHALIESADALIKVSMTIHSSMLKKSGH